MTDVRWRGTAGLRRETSRGVQSLDEGRVLQRVATGGALLGCSRRNLEPGNGILRDEIEVGGGITKVTWNSGISWPHPAPDGARVAVLPRDANRAIGDHRRIRVGFGRAGAEEMG